MLEAIRSLTQGVAAKVILAIITIPFALFGIDSYLNGAGGNVSVAEVGDEKISIQEYSNAVENMRNRIQSQGEQFDPTLLEKPEFKQLILDGLVTRRLVSADVLNHNFQVGDNQLSQYILGMQEFQENGQFSEELYHRTLEQNKLTATDFENSIRQDMVTRQARDELANLAFVPASIAEETVKIAFQTRDVSTAELKGKDFLDAVSVSDEEVDAYYKLHKEKFKVPEKVKLEFALLSVNGIVPKVSSTVTDEEVKEFYEQNLEKFQGNEQREASHILFGFGVSATDEDKQKVKEDAEMVLAQVQANPDRFEEYAAKHSHDPGSAEKGGSLGSFGRGAMVKPFEDAVFSMEPSQISDLVESEFGYHIIRLDGVTGESADFESLKLQIKGELIFLKAQALYAEKTEEFGNIVYEQSGSLKPAAEKFDLELQTSEWMSKEEGMKFFGDSERFMNMVFSDEVLKEKRNTEAFEVKPNNLVSARVVDYKPEAPRTFDEVKGGIKDLLKIEKALAATKEKGDAMLTKLQAGEEVEDLEWIPTVTVDRKDAQGLTEPVMRQVFKINTDTLPAYKGFIENNRAYVFVKVSDVKNNLSDDEGAKEMAMLDFERALATEYTASYGRSLKAKSDIKVNSQLILGNDDQ